MAVAVGSAVDREGGKRLGGAVVAGGGGVPVASRVSKAAVERLGVLSASRRRAVLEGIERQATRRRAARV